MPQHRGRLGEWPTVRDEPLGTFQVPDGTLRSARSLAGRLRLGTSPGVGPRGFADADSFRGTDFGMDRVDTRCHDPIGREPYTATSTLISRNTRRR